MADIKKDERAGRLYPFLQQKTEDQLRIYSGKLWTDFSIHDPGVTVNDILNYALTDFDYRLGYNLEDYFMSKGEKSFIPEKFGLFHPSVLEQKGIVTSDDYKQLFLDNIPEIYSVEIKTADDYTGLFDIKALINSTVEESSYPEIEEQIRQLYYNNRNLCEDINIITLDNAKKKATTSSIPQGKNTIDTYPAQHRELFEYRDIREDFPAFYGINKWGDDHRGTGVGKRQTDQLKTYLSLFDDIVKDGLNELKELPSLFCLTEAISQKKRINLFISYLNNLDKLYGEDSNPDFIHSGDVTEGLEEMITRRIDFIYKIPHWGRNRHKAYYLNKESNFFGLEAYLKSLFKLDHNEHIHIVEHIFLRELSEPIRSEDYVEPDFPIELGLTVILYGTSTRMKESAEVNNNGFRSGLTEFIYSHLPAHLDARIVWPSEENYKKFGNIYSQYIKEPNDDNGGELKEFLIKLREA